MLWSNIKAGSSFDLSSIDSHRSHVVDSIRFEFAIIEITASKISQKFRGDVIGPWVSFFADDVVNQLVSLDWDGKTFHQTGPSTVKLHRAEESPFA